VPVELPDGSFDTVDAFSEVALPGLVFDAESVDISRPWYDMTLTTPSAVQSFLGKRAWRNYTGYFNVFIYCPLSFGEAKDLCYAQPVLNAFRMGTEYSDDSVYISCTAADVIGSEKEDVYNRWKIAVRVVFRAEVKS
jgi:hypothetical protein